MNFFKSIFLMLLSLIIFINLGLQVYSYSSFNGLETKVFHESNEGKIKKVQNALKAFGLYEGEIDGNYENLRGSLIAYQKKAGIINNENHESAGYFGVKTLTALKRDFPDTFESVSNNYLKMDEPLYGDRYFYITAYYSPLPGQKRYTTGSYRGDVRLNGGGKVTASGKGVFPGLLAGPRNYKFGTKIMFDGLGVGAIEDRGGAIVNAGERGHEYDRIDVWMGYGDEGLERALKWGKRKVKGHIVLNDVDISIAFDESVVTKYRGLKVDAENPKSENVKRLQLLFTDVGLYKGLIDGRFESIKDKLIKFQVENNIITGNNDPAAGYFGNKTYAVLRKMHGGGVFKEFEKKPGDDILLAKVEKRKLNKIKSRIDKFLDKKFKGNKSSSNKYKKKLKKSIQKNIEKVKNTTTKNKLRYLNAVI